MLLFDPTFLFCAGCLAVSPAMSFVRNSKEVFQADLKAYLTNPVLVAGIVMTIVFLLIGSRNKNKLTWGERTIANWFLLNGTIIHFVMDGLTGGWHLLPLLDGHYRIIDKRFDTDEANSWIITQMELWILFPLCVYTYFAYVKKSNNRFILNVLVSALQLYGAVMFFGAEYLNNFPNIPVDRKLEFTFHHLLYFWFAYGANLLWVVIPTALIYQAIAQNGAYDRNGIKKLQ